MAIPVSRSPEYAAARATVEQAQRDVDDRANIDVATGVLMGNQGCSAEQAEGLLRQPADQEARPILEIAQRIIRQHSRAVLPDGEDLTLRNEQEHQRINELFSQLYRTRPEDPRRPQLVSALVDLLHQDVRDEEDLLLPRLQQALTVQQLRRLGRTWELVRRTAPTRPHPVVSRRPPGNLVSGLPLAVLDRSRDRLDRTARSVPALATPAAVISRALAVVAGAFEHLRPVQRGERAATSVGQTP